MEYFAEYKEATSILIVDDETATLEVMGKLIEREGFITTCVSSGAEALWKLEKQQFACMITDFHMLAMNGLELATQAQTIDPHMPIVLCTGDVSPFLRKDAAAAGIKAVFRKPVDFQDILKMLQEETGSLGQNRLD